MSTNVKTRLDRIERALPKKPTAKQKQAQKEEEARAVLLPQAIKLRMINDFQEKQKLRQEAGDWSERKASMADVDWTPEEKEILNAVLVEGKCKCQFEPEQFFHSCKCREQENVNV